MPANDTETIVRCPWCGDNQLYVMYHDREWGVPLHDDRQLFELLTLEGAQAGLSWLTVLKRREDYRRAFDNFDVQRVAKYGADKIEQLLADSTIIRNRLKIMSTITNAQAVLRVQQTFGSLDSYLWQFVDNTPIQHHIQGMSAIPSVDVIAQTMSRDLLKHGFRFVGPTICYAYMQSAGMVNDHLTSCFRYPTLAKT